MTTPTPAKPDNSFQLTLAGLRLLREQRREKEQAAKMLPTGNKTTPPCRLSRRWVVVRRQER